MLVPTLPIINNGPALLVKIKRRFPSSFVIFFSERKLATTFAPTGYPDISPIIKGYAEIAGTLNNFFIIGSSFDEISEIIKVWDNSSLAIKNGNKLGNIVFKNRSMELRILTAFEEDKIISPKQNNITKSVNK